MNADIYFYEMIIILCVLAIRWWLYFYAMREIGFWVNKAQSTPILGYFRLPGQAFIVTISDYLFCILIMPAIALLICILLYMLFDYPAYQSGKLDDAINIFGFYGLAAILVFVMDRKIIHAIRERNQIPKNWRSLFNR